MSKKLTIQEGLALLPDLEKRMQNIRPLAESPKEMFEIQQKRETVQAGTNLMEDVTVQIPKIAMKDVLKEYDTTASKIRKLKNAIQMANLQTEIDFTTEDDPTNHDEPVTGGTCPSDS